VSGGKKMSEDKSKEKEAIKKRWDEHAKTYDQWYQTFEGACENYIDWELLKPYLPKNKDAKILDAAGGTGRITLPLAKMGYSVTLCDISPAMLNVAKEKMKREGVLDKVEISECDVQKLDFPDESFDFVLCWDGMFEAAKELVRVTKRRGIVSIFFLNKCSKAIRSFVEKSDYALDLLASETSYAEHDQEKHIALSSEEAKEFVEKEGIRVIQIYAVCGMLDFLSIPAEVLKSTSWDEEFFKKTTEMLLRLSKEPSVKGISRHLVLYGQRI